MKAIFICVIIAMLGSAQGFKDRICNLDPFVQGPCLEVMTLYSYLSARNECVFWQGCWLNGNQFTNKTECEAKCKTSFLR
nr:BPTI/Kunitz domain-containing protein 4 [Drosophila suzukii]